jgi:drug/metabolite transporter (DMT)-like permease
MSSNAKKLEPVASDTQGMQSVTARYLSYINPFHFKKRGTRGKAYIALAAVCFLWGIAWLVSKEGVRYMPALQLAGIRQFVGGICFVIFFLYKGKTLPKGDEWKSIFILSFLNFILSNGLSTWGVKYISAGLGSIIGSIFPLWLVIIHLSGSKTKLNSKTTIGLLLGFTGICVIFYEHLHEFFNPQFRFGIFLSLISTWSWALGMIYTKKHAANFNPYFSLGLQMVVAGIFLIFITNVTNTAIPLVQIPWQSWAAIGYLIVFSSFIAFIAFLYALQNLSTEQTSLYAYVTPIISILLGWLLLNEMMTVFIIWGSIITLSGVYFVNKGGIATKK